MPLRIVGHLGHEKARSWKDAFGMFRLLFDREWMIASYGTIFMSAREYLPSIGGTTDFLGSVSWGVIAGE